MSADETYENITHHKLNNHNQPILVAADVKNIMLVPNIVNRSKEQAHLQSSVFKLSKDLIDSIHEEGIVAYTS